MEIGTQVPAIISRNGNEGTIFWLSSGVPFVAFNETMYDTVVDYNFWPWNETVKAQYPVSAFSTSRYPTFEAMSTIITDFYFKCPAYRALKGAVDKNVTAFSYLVQPYTQLRVASRLPSRQEVSQRIGATHLGEIPFVFGIKNGLPPADGNCSFTQQVTISDFMMNAWTSMARRQLPAPSNAWLAWSTARRDGVTFDAVPAVGYQDYKACDFWDPVTANIFELAQNNLH